MISRKKEKMVNENLNSIPSIPNPRTEGENISFDVVVLHGSSPSYVDEY